MSPESLAHGPLLLLRRTRLCSCGGRAQPCRLGLHALNNSTYVMAAAGLQEFWQRCAQRTVFERERETETLRPLAC